MKRRKKKKKKKERQNSRVIQINWFPIRWVDVRVGFEKVYIYVYLQDVETDEFRFVEPTFIWNDYARWTLYRQSRDKIAINFTGGGSFR